MASFKIHEDQENPLPAILRKDNAENVNVPRRALGSLNQNVNHQRILKSKAQSNDLNIRNNDNRVRPILKHDKVSVPVAQFEAISVYEDKPEEKSDVVKPTIKIHAKRDETDLLPSVLTLNPHRLPLQEKLKHEDVDSPMSIGQDSILCPMSIVKSETKGQEEEKKATAKTVRELFFHVAEYREDIYNYMREIELKHRARPGYMKKQPDISNSMRAILVDWLVEVSEEYRLQTETLYLAVSYIDRFLSFMSVVRAKLQLVGTAAMFIASKYEEIYPPDVGEFVYITDDTYSKQQVLRMEHLILKVLSFDLSTPTPLAFISHFCIVNGLTQKTLYLAMYISELALLEAETYLQYPSSIIGASALAVARHALLCCHCTGRSPGEGDAEAQIPPAACLLVAWPDNLRKSSGYGLAEMERCMRQLEMTHAGEASQPHHAILDKYKSSKYEGVSHIEAKSMYPVTELTSEDRSSKVQSDSDTSLTGSLLKQVESDEAGKRS